MAAEQAAHDETRPKRAPRVATPPPEDEYTPPQEFWDKGVPPTSIFTCQRCEITKQVKAYLVPAQLICTKCRGLVQARIYDDEGSRL